MSIVLDSSLVDPALAAFKSGRNAIDFWPPLRAR
jgi:hypothetical protein